MIRVAIIADTRLYREGLTLALQRGGALSVVASWATMAAALAALPANPSDVVLLDMATPGALDQARDLVRASPAKVVALGVADTEHDLVSCAGAGVTGYVLREASLDDLIGCLTSVARGEVSCSPRLAAAILRHVEAIAARSATSFRRLTMTRREQTVLELVDQGMSNREIALRLTIEVTTVKEHIHNILEKLGVKRRGEAAALFRQSAWRSTRVTV
jgi:DNA-binding NarL/FixJ family response regulator